LKIDQKPSIVLVWIAPATYCRAAWWTYPDPNKAAETVGRRLAQVVFSRLADDAGKGH
jgi:hypothetical protein